MSDDLTYHYKYPHPSVAIDVVVFSIVQSALRLLLIERAHDPFKGYWALPGGFLNIDESAEIGAKRELCEETGVKIDALNQFHVFTEPNRDPRERVISIAYYSLTGYLPLLAGDDANNAAWFDLESLPKLAFDHEKIFHSAALNLYRDLSFPTIEDKNLFSKFTNDQLLTLKLKLEEVFNF